MNSLPSPDGRSLIYFDSEREGGVRREGSVVGLHGEHRRG